MRLFFFIALAFSSTVFAQTKTVTNCALLSEQLIAPFFEIFSYDNISLADSSSITEIYEAAKDLENKNICKLPPLKNCKIDDYPLNYQYGYYDYSIYGLDQLGQYHIISASNDGVKIYEQLASFKKQGICE